VQSSEAPLVQDIPADLRHGRAGRGLKARDAAGDDAEALQAAVLVAALEQQLQPQADAQVRPALQQVLPQRIHIALVMGCSRLWGRVDVGLTASMDSIPATGSSSHQMPCVGTKVQQGTLACSAANAWPHAPTPGKMIRFALPMSAGEVTCRNPDLANRTSNALHASALHAHFS
jgi:hypothetical protein